MQLLAIFILVLLTRPDNFPVWINSNQLVAVQPAPSYVHADARTQIDTTFGPFFVREKPEEVVERFNRMEQMK